MKVKVINNTIIESRLIKAGEYDVPKDLSKEDLKAIKAVGNIEEEGNIAPSASSSKANLLYSVKEALELIAAAVTIAEVDEVIEGDTRQNVLDAAASKKAELKAELEKEAEDAK